VTTGKRARGRGEEEKRRKKEGKNKKHKKKQKKRKKGKRNGYDTIRYDTRCYFNVRSKADISQLNLPHGTDN